MEVPPRKRLAPADWIAAALDGLRDAGLEGVAVEPLAARLGATKGSFYWHFSDREALVAAALARWEHDETDEVIAALETAADPAQRLELLIRRAFDARLRPDLSINLFADAEHPLVAAALERVTRRRIDYLREQYQSLGLHAEDAQTRALHAYTTFLGVAQLRRHLPALAQAAEMNRHIALLRQLASPIARQ